MFLFKKIHLNGNFKNYLNEDLKPLNFINDLSKVNIFIGANNSGKSRFIRELLNLKIEKFDFIEDGGKESSNLIEKINFITTNLNKIFTNNFRDDLIYTDLDKGLKLDKKDFLIENLDSYIQDNINIFLEKIKRIIEISKLKGSVIHMGNSSFKSGSFVGDGNVTNFIDEISQFFITNKEIIDFVMNFNVKIPDFKLTYIPILRTLVGFNTKNLIYKNTEVDSNISDFDHLLKIPEMIIKKDFYKDITKENYKIEDDKINIFTGQNLYLEIRKKLLGEKKDRELIQEYQKFLSECFFDNKDVSLLPKEEDDKNGTLSIRIGDEEKKIYELGDGIQSLIILTFQLFMVDNGLFFIEEPELNLHPGMQRKFLEIILNNPILNSKNHQYFITSHSNHILDLTLDEDSISIYKLKTDKNNFENKILSLSKSGDNNILQELGVNSSSVFISNCTIWVEGITDRLYIRKFLELYQFNNNDKYKNLSEDINYSFFEYGGNNINHFLYDEDDNEYKDNINFTRLFSNAYVIVDKDEEGKKKKRKEKIAEIFEDNFRELKCREIENILSPKSLQDGIVGFKKTKDFKIDSNIKQEDYINEKIGNYIDTVLKPVGKSFEDDSGTVKEKVKFCNNVINNIEYGDMTDEAISLVKDILEFISKNN